MNAATSYVFLDAIFSAIICWQAVAHVGRMNHKTRHSIRVAFLVLAASSFVIAVMPDWIGHDSDLADVVAHASMAALLLFDRRRPTDCPHVDDCDWQRRNPTPSRLP